MEALRGLNLTGESNILPSSSPGFVRLLRTVSRRAGRLREIGLEVAEIGKGDFLPTPLAERDVGIFLSVSSHLFCKGRWGIGVLYLNGRTLHVFAGGLLGTGLGGGSYGGGKTNSLFGLDAAG